MSLQPIAGMISGLRKSIEFVTAGVGQLIWPAVCLNCGSAIGEIGGELCGSCWQQIQSCVGGEYCTRCGREGTGYAALAGGCPSCQGQEISFDGIARGGIYANAMQRMILALKSSRSELDSVLGFLAEGALAGGGLGGEIDFFVPVPLHWRRRLLRGYNQSMLLAKMLKASKGKINTELVRIRHTKRQPMTASAAQRRANVAGAFAVRRGHKFAGHNICLVDDIKTTGATLNECARVLKHAGASKVFALVLAVAGQQAG